VTAPLFEVEHVTKRYGGLTAVNDVSLSLDQGELVGLIGANGAGKTTLFNLITGADTVTSGAVRWQGRDIDKMAPWERARLGMARTFQNIRLWQDMSVADNVAAVLPARSGTGICASVLRLPAFRRAEAGIREDVHTLLGRLGLADEASARAGDLPYGDQRRLEIARAMCTGPELLCLDEPAAGLNPRESAALNELLLSIREVDKTSVLLIEHDMSVVMGISDHIVVLDYGRKIADGTPQQVREDHAVIAAYLGVEEDEETEALREVEQEARP